MASPIIVVCGLFSSDCLSVPYVEQPQLTTINISVVGRGGRSSGDLPRLQFTILLFPYRNVESKKWNEEMLKVNLVGGLCKNWLLSQVDPAILYILTVRIRK